MNINGKRYNEDFKQTIIELYNSGSLVSELERKYGVTRTTIYKWIKENKVIKVEDQEPITPKDIAEMKKENAKLKEEIEILKKALTIFAKK
ncbi:transposase [Crassaminicella indica]|uniref:Transposase n=1 Tax=Crassaminicella indica TaxID=2855394 RepID=A0ABX8RDG3_9CLOT|nr:transposase [Crassaminicella indica]QXM07107.1 transposase [Crassaminicella indica]